MLQPVYTEQFTLDLEKKLSGELRKKAEKICERLMEYPIGAAHSHRLKHRLSGFRAADLATRRRGHLRIIFGLHGEHPDVEPGTIVFFFISRHYE